MSPESGDVRYGVLRMRWRWEIAVVVACGCVGVIVVGFLGGRRHEPNGLWDSFDEMKERYRACGSDQARWEVAKVQLGAWVGVDRSQEDFAKRQLLASHLLSYVWVKGYPGIVRKMEFTRDDLLFLARILDLGTRDVYLPERGADGRVRVNVESRVSPREIAREWLEILVGRSFRDGEDLRGWVRMEGDLLWNRESGHFNNRVTPYPFWPDRVNVGL